MFSQFLLQENQLNDAPPFSMPHLAKSTSRLRPRSTLLPLQRFLHLAPPFLLDDYTPRYHLLSLIEASKKRSAAYALLKNCNLCPRRCSVNRYERTGFCLIGAETAKVNVIAPHFGEEPCIQGHNGSGSVFFSGCNLRCVFCQNHDIAHQRNGFDATPEELAEWYMKLQEVGKVHNINLITPEHVVPQVVLSILHAKDLGLRLPIVYNTSAFDSMESLDLLDGLVDIYLPDFKVWAKSSSQRLLKAEDYASAAKESIKAMQNQVGDLSFTPDGIAKKGLLLRHLVMPGKEDEGREIMRWLGDNISRDIFVNIMEQYHPDANVGKPSRSSRASTTSTPSEHTSTDQPSDGTSSVSLRYNDINRAVTGQEISSVRKAAEDAGIWRFCDPVRHDGFNL